MRVDVAVIFLSLLGPAAAMADAVVDRPPNVVLVMTDDQGWGDLGRHGNERIDTPVLDRLAAEAIRFERFFVSPVCAPTRAGLLTGRDFLRTGVSGVTHRREVMRSEEVTIAEILKQAGYATGCFGKWHNGRQYPNHANGQGFDEFFGFCGGAWNLYVDARLEHNGRAVETRGYITDVLTDAAIAFIEKHRDGSFFCYVPYNAPHGPFVVPDRYFDKYNNRGLDDQTAAVYGMVENIDENVGRILDKLDALDLARHTLVLFLTDNGPNGKRYNGGMKGAKGSVDEGGVRVPLLLRYPARLEGDRTIHEIASHVDLLPTIVELCGVEMPETPPLDGKSLVPLLEGRTPDWPDRMLFSYRVGRGEPLPISGAVRTQRYRLVCADRPGKPRRYALYDMLADPGQTTDVAGRHPDVRKRLAAAYDARLTEVTASGLALPPIPVGHAEAERVALSASACRLSGGVRFANSIGWTTDWITGWTSGDDRLAWELDVWSAGTYEVTLLYSCGPEDVGARVRVEAGGQAAEQRIDRPFDTGLIPRPDRAAATAWQLREFARLKLGTLALAQGPTRLVLSAREVPGAKVCDLDGLELRRVTAPRVRPTSAASDRTPP